MITLTRQLFNRCIRRVISSDRIIKMLNVVDDQIVVEERNLLDREIFNSPQLMYWQVYLHKT